MFLTTLPLKANPTNGFWWDNIGPSSCRNSIGVLNLRTLSGILLMRYVAPRTASPW